MQIPLERVLQYISTQEEYNLYKCQAELSSKKKNLIYLYCTNVKEH